MVGRQNGQAEWVDGAPKVFDGGQPVGSEAMSSPASIAGRAQLSDAVLIVGVTWRQVDALAGIYARYSGAVYALALGLVRDGTIAEKLIEEVFLGLWLEPDRFRDGASEHLDTLLYADCVQRATGKLRESDARSDDGGGSRRVAADTDVQAMRATHDTRSAIQQALQEIPVEERSAILVTRFGRRTYRETAALLGESDATIRRRLGSGMRRLRRLLADAGDEP